MILTPLIKWSKALSFKVRQEDEIIIVIVLIWAGLQCELWLQGQTRAQSAQTQSCIEEERISKENSGIVSDMIVFRWPLRTKKIFWDRLILTGVEVDHKKYSSNIFIKIVFMATLSKIKVWRRIQRLIMDSWVKNTPTYRKRRRGRRRFT